MASARTLSTTELGATRYSQAASTNTWPVQVCINPDPSNTSLNNQYKLVIPTVPDTPFSQTWHNDLRATTTLCTGIHTYKIYRDGQLVFSDQIHVQPGEPPLATTKLASELTGRRPSGVTQIADSVHGKATVSFVYAEETHSVRGVYAIADDVEVTLQRDDNGDFVGEGTLNVGENSIRYRVVPREWTRPEVAAFTRLGWDDCAGERGVLVTWPLRVDVQDVINKVKEQVTENDGNGGFGVVLVGIAVVVAGLAFAIVLGPGKEKEAVESVEEEAEQIQTPVAIGVDNVERDVLRHMQSNSM